jgi:hypothetical protein
MSRAVPTLLSHLAGAPLMRAEKWALLTVTPYPPAALLDGLGFIEKNLLQISARRVPNGPLIKHPNG